MTGTPAARASFTARRLASRAVSYTHLIGKGGHSAFPETCVDPVVTAAQIITALQTIVSRRVRAVEPAVVSVCMVQGLSLIHI